MAEELANLRIRVQSLEAEVAERRLNRLERAGRGAERATDGLTASIAGFIGPAALAAAGIAALTKVTNVTREFDVLNAQLITATGNAENAAVAFEAIQDFAASTPYDLQQATTAFTRLVNLGLTPSERALTSYGDTASAMGKDLIQLVEAVADATTGEFERLKEFGIRSKREGDQITFTFRGVKETVQFESAAIEEYLTRLGENNFAGAMAERMKTLDGAMSNMGDSWNRLWLEISNQGVGDIIEESARTATSALDELTDRLASGQLAAEMEASARGFDGLLERGDNAFNEISMLFDNVPQSWLDQFSAFVDAAAEYFRTLPISLNASIGRAGAYISLLVDYAEIYGQGFVDLLVAKFEQLVDTAAAYGVALGEALNPFSEDTFDLSGALGQIDAEYARINDRVKGQIAERTAAVEADNQTALQAIEQQRQAATRAFDERLEQSRKLREQYEKDREARRGGGDRLGAFGQGVSEEDREKQRQARLAQQREENLAKVAASLQTEEEAIQSSYDRRLQIILDNTEEGSERQADLIERLNEQFAEQAMGEFRDVNSYDDELARIEEFYMRRKELILNNAMLTEEERTALEEELTKERNDRIEALEMQRTSVILASSADMFGSLAQIAKVYGGEQSSLYRGLFVASKAFAIADTTIKGVQAVQKAWAEVPYPANIAAATQAGVTAAANVATIASTGFAGAFDKGGEIPAGQFGLVGEFGPELIEGPTRVTSRRETAEAFKQAQQAAPQPAQMQAPNVTFNPVMVMDSALLSDYLQTPEGEDAIMQIVERNKVA